jgi:hypothetical protein
MKADNVKQFFVYANITFIVVAGFYVLYQLATRQDLPANAGVPTGMAAIFSGFVGACIQFLTGSEIATRANRAATGNFAAGSTASAPTTVTAQASPTQATVTATPNTASPLAPEPAPPTPPPGDDA